MNAVLKLDVDRTAISLSSSALLVDLTLRGWTGKKQDRDVADEVDSAKHTTVRAGVYQKNLLAGSEELASINKYAAMVRSWHAMRTLPWADTGTRLLPTAAYQDYLAEFSQHEVEHQRLVGELVREYDLLIQAAQFRLGALFKASDYPDPSEIPGKFAMSLSINPLPEAGDFRVDIGRQGLDELRERFADQQQNRINEAVSEVRDRVKTVIQKISNQLRIESDGSKGRIHDSVIENALELCDSLVGFNLTKDPELESIRKELSLTLRGIDSKEVRKDDSVRIAAKQELDAILDKWNF
jgi:hypothetical protein